MKHRQRFIGKQYKVNILPERTHGHSEFGTGTINLINIHTKINIEEC